MQLGVDVPISTLPGATRATQRMLAALAVGVPRSGLSLIGTEAGASEADVRALLDAVRPALLPEAPEPTPRPRVAVDGMGRTAVLLRELVPDNGMELAHHIDPAASDGVDAAVIIARFAVIPAQHGAWLRRDLPHLPIVFGDRMVRVGPFVEPGSGPCVHCTELERVDADPAWPAMATQLAGKNAAAETALGALDAASRAIRMLTARLIRQSGAQNANTSILIDEATGVVTTRSHRPHGRCGCQSLPENVTPLGPLRDRLSATPTRWDAPGRPNSVAGDGAHG
jgi:bacteriocin biosynthesis cyclodehydratase domain-containing protein